MEPTTVVAPPEQSTGSSTIADLMALAAERYGDDPPRSDTSATASGTTSPSARSARSSRRSAAG